MNNVQISTGRVTMVQEIKKNEQCSNIAPEHAARPATALRHEQLRQELIATAAEVIETQGLAELRARDLAKSAGCSLGTLYNVFTDMDGLILEVNASTLRAIDRSMRDIYEPDPVQKFQRLADAYISYAVANRRRWDALFSHRQPAAPGWFLALQSAAFSHAEGPLAQLCPALGPAARAQLGRGIFAAVHGMVALELEQRFGQTDLPGLRGQVAQLVLALAHGLPAVPRGAL